MTAATETDARGRTGTVLLLHGTLLVSGASVMVLEILGTRVLGPFYGLGVHVWAALITVTLAALALGYQAGGALADRSPSPALFHGIVVAAGAATLAVRLVSGSILDALGGLGLEAGALVAALLIFGPALFLLGTLTPFACRLHPDHASRTGGTVGRLYAVSTVGSVGGALLAAFVLLPRWPVGAIFLGTALALGATGAVGLLLRRAPPPPVAASAAAALLVAYVLLGHSRAGPPHGVTLVRDEQTFYNRIQTVDADGERYLMLDGLIHTHLRLDDPDDPVRCEYVRVADLVPAVRPGARRFLAIGCGGGGMLRLLEGEGRTFDVVDVDEAVIRAAREDFGAGVEGATFHVGDGRMFLRREGTWDAALLDVVSTEVMPEHLCTVEFLRELRARLVPGGVVLMNSIGRPGGRVLDSFGKTLREAFAHVTGYTAHLEEASTNVVWLASDGPIELPELESYAYEGRVYETGAKGVVLRDDYNPVNAWNSEVGLALRRQLHRRFGRTLFEAR